MEQKDHKKELKERLTMICHAADPANLDANTADSMDFARNTGQALCMDLSRRLETAEPGLELNALSAEIHGMRFVSEEERQQILADLYIPDALPGPRVDGVAYTSWQINGICEKTRRQIELIRQLVAAPQPLSAHLSARLHIALDTVHQFRRILTAKPLSLDQSWRHGLVFVFDVMPISALVVLLMVCFILLWLTKKSADHFTAARKTTSSLGRNNNE